MIMVMEVRKGEEEEMRETMILQRMRAGEGRNQRRKRRRRRRRGNIAIKILNLNCLN